MRKMGYYAGWANRRPCGISNPNDFDWSGYTHAHFAFAVISQSSQIRAYLIFLCPNNPSTYRRPVELASADVPLLQQLVAQKTSNPSMKVLIAVGGWDFSWVLSVLYNVVVYVANY
jgi:GH18 family chitinase